MLLLEGSESCSGTLVCSGLSACLLATAWSLIYCTVIPGDLMYARSINFYGVCAAFDYVPYGVNKTARNSYQDFIVVPVFVAIWYRTVHNISRFGNSYAYSTICLFLLIFGSAIFPIGYVLDFDHLANGGWQGSPPYSHAQIIPAILVPSISDIS